jgi:serine/threonine protein kinase
MYTYIDCLNLREGRRDHFSNCRMGFSTRVGKYELGRDIGEGMFAKVKVARNMETGVNVAVKIIDKKMIFRCNLMHQVGFVLLQCMIHSKKE